MGIALNGVAIAARKNNSKLFSAWKKVIASGVFIDGDQNKTFTNSLSHLFRKHVALVASGHDALELTLRSLHFHRTDEVIVPANAYPTAFPVLLAGATLKLCDVDENGQLDPAALKKSITKRTKAVIMVHLYGMVGDISSIVSICKQKNIFLIEDCAQAFGSTFKGRPVGTFGNVGCFSFYPTKNLGGLGTGGAIISNNLRLIKRISMAISYGETTRYHSTFIAGHSWGSELIWAGLNVYFETFRTLSTQKARVARWYQRAFARVPSVAIVSSHPSSTPVIHLFVIRVKQREKLRTYLKTKGIPTGIHYPLPIYRVPSMKSQGFNYQDFPQTETLSKEILTIPYHPYLKRGDVQLIAGSIARFYENYRR